VPFGSDGAVGMEAVRARYESELANEYGNLASRSVAMIRRYRDGVLAGGATDPVLHAEFDGLAEGVAELMDRAEVTQALDLIWQRVRRCNRYVEERKPWELAKQADAAGELDQVLASLGEGVRALSVLLHPYMPASTARALEAIGHDAGGYAGASFAATTGELRVGELPPLFPKR
jgi:methionyl-tRNA synthetase